MSKANSKTSRISRAKQLILGTQKHFPNASQSLTFGGATSTVADLTKLVQSLVDNRTAVEAAQAAAKAKVEIERTQAPSQIAVITAFEAFVRGMFGNSADALADFGLTPRKRPGPMSAEQKAVAVAKRTATREARHTMGPKQKKGIKGAVKAALVVTGSATPPPTPTPHTA